MFRTSQNNNLQFQRSQMINQISVALPVHSSFTAVSETAPAWRYQTCCHRAQVHRRFPSPTQDDRDDRPKLPGETTQTNQYFDMCLMNVDRCGFCVFFPELFSRQIVRMGIDIGTKFITYYARMHLDWTTNDGDVCHNSCWNYFIGFRCLNL